MSRTTKDGAAAVRTKRLSVHTSSRRLKRAVAAAALAYAASAIPLRAADSFWDINGSGAGSSGGTTAAGNWDDANWSVYDTGSGMLSNSFWVDGNTPVFAAGTNATGAYSVQLTGGFTYTVAGMRFEEGTVTLAPNGFDPATIVLGSSTVDISSGAAGIVGVHVDGTSGLTKTGSGTLTLATSNTFTGGVTISAGTLGISADNNLGNASNSISLNSGTLSVTETFSSARNVSLASGVTSSLSVASGKTLTLSGVISGGGSSHSFRKEGAGTLLLSGTNTYSASGNLYVNAGTVMLGSNDALPSGSQLAGSASGTVDLNGFNPTLSIFSPGSIINSSGTQSTLSVTGNVGFNTSTVVSGNVAINYAGTGVLELASAQTYTGPTTISSGSIMISVSNRLPDTTAMTISSGGTFVFNGNLNETIGSLAGAGAVTLGGGTLTVGGDNTSTGYSGTITGTGTLTKTGTGTFNVTSASVFGGSTVVSGGTLQSTLTNMPTSVANSATVSFGAVINGGTYSGTISGGGAITMGGVTGLGALPAGTLNGDFTGSGSIFIRNMGLTLTGSTGRISGSSTIDVARGSLSITNSSTNSSNRLGDSATVLLRGSNLTLLGNPSADSTETMGAIVLNSGGMNHLTLTSANQTSAAFGASLTAGTYARAPGGVLLVRGNLLGQNNATGVNGTRLLFSNAPSVSGLGTSSATTLTGILAASVAAGATTAVTGTTATLATYDTNGVRNLNSSEYSATISAGTNFAPATNQTAPSDLTINSIEFGGAGTAAATAGNTLNLGGNTVTVSSGMILSNATGPSTLSSGTLAFGDAFGAGEAIFASYGSGSISTSSVISASALTKVGSGTLLLTGSSANLHGGGTHIQQGILSVSSPNVLGSSVDIGNAGWFELLTTGFQGGQLQLSGSNHYTMPLSIAGSYTAGTQAVASQGMLNNASGNNTWSGDITLNGFETNSGNKQYNSISAQAGTLTISGVIKNGVNQDGSAISAGLITTGTGDIVLTGAAPNTFDALFRPTGGRLIVEKNGAFGPATATNALGVLMTSSLSRSAIAFRAPSSSPAGFHYSNFEWLTFAGFGINSGGDGMFLQNLGGDNTFSGGISFGSEAVIAGYTNPSRVDIAAGSLTLNGPIAGRSASARAIIKEGAGDLIYTYDGNAAFPTSASVFVLTGSLLDIKAGSVIVRGAGVMPAGFTAYKVGVGSALTFDNTTSVNSQRINSSASIDLVNGELKLIGNASTPVTQVASGINVAGQSVFTVSANGSSTSLRFANSSNVLQPIARSNLGTALLRGLDGSNGKIELAGTLQGGGGSNGQSTISILPYVVGDASISGGGTDFVTIDSGFARLLTAGEYIPLASGNASLNNTVSSGVSIGGATSVNSIKITSGSTVTIANGQQLNVHSGAVLGGASGTSTIAGGGTLQFGQEAIVTAPTGGTLAISSVIGGTGGLTKSGGGVLQLTGTNTYGSQAGSLTTINSGTLEFNSDSNLGTAGRGISINGGTLRPLTSATISRAVSLSSVGANTIDVGSGTNATFAGNVTGNGLVKTGSGTLTLSDLGNGYTGGTLISGGSIAVDPSSPTQPQLGSGGVTLNGGSLRAEVDSVLDRSLISTSSGSTGGFYIAPGKTLTYGSGSSSTVGMSGSGNYAIDGGGTLVLAKVAGAAMTYTGRLIVNNGSTLTFEDNGGGNRIAGIGGASVVPAEWVVLNDNSRLKFNLTSNGAADFSGNTRGITINSGGGKIEIAGTNTVLNTGGIFGSGNVTKEGAGLYSLRTSGVTNGFTGKWIVSAGTLEFGTTGNNGEALGLASGADAITLSNGAFLQSTTTSATGTIPSTMGITLNGGATANIGAKTGAVLTINSAISGIGSNVNFNGVNTTPVSGSTLTGTVILAGSSSNIYSGSTTLQSGTLRLNKSTEVNAIPGDFTVNSGATVQWLADEQVANNAILTLNSGGTIDLNGHTETVSGFIDNGGTTTLNGGQLIVSGGNLSLGNGTTINSLSNVSGDVIYAGTNTTASINALLNFTGVSSHNFNIANGTANPDVSVTGAISSSTSVTKIGAGTLNLSGSGSSITGGLTASTGVTNLTGGSIGISAMLTVGESASATFNQSGGAATVNSLTLGNSFGSLGTYNLSAGSVTVSSGAVNIGKDGDGELNLSGTGSFSATGGNDVIVGFDGAGAVDQTGGTASITNVLKLGLNSASAASYNLSSGSLTAGGEIIGVAGAASFDQTGGTNNLSSGSLLLGSSSGGAGDYTISGGSVTAAQIYVGGSSSGAGGTGTLTVNTGGTVTSTGALTVYDAGSNVVNLAGGTLNAGTIDTEGDPSRFNWTSGTLHTNSMLVQPGTALGANMSLGAGKTLTLDSFLVVGDSGVGTFTQSGGTVTVGSFLRLGDISSGDGTYTMSGGMLSTSTTSVGYGGAGAFVQTGGTHAIGTSGLHVGGQSGVTGTYSLSGTGAITVNADETVGSAGSGTFTQSAGTNTITGNLNLGLFGTGNGTYTTSGGTMSAVGIYVGGHGGGAGGTGTLNVNTGATVTASGTLKIYNSGSNVVNLSGGTLNAGSLDTGGNASRLNWSTGTLNITNSTLSIESGGALGATLTLGAGKSLSTNGLQIIGAAGTGSVIQTGGTNTAGALASSGNLFIGMNAGSNGSYALSGSGQLVSNNNVNVGYEGDGTFTQTGGTATIGTGVANRSLSVASVAGATGQYDLSSGSLTVVGDGEIGEGGAGIFNQSGGTADFSGNVHIAYSAGSSGALTASGGNTIAGSVYVGGSGSSAGGVGILNVNTGGTVNAGTNLKVWSSGTLNVAGGTLSAGALTGTGAVNINSGGFTVGTGNSSSTFSGTLAGAGTLTKTGSGTLTIAGTQNWTSGAALVVSAGLVSLDTNAGPAAKNLSINASGGNVTFNASQNLATLTVAGGRIATLAATGSRLIDVTSLAIAGATNDWQGKVNLEDGDLIVRYTSGNGPAKLAQITNQIKSGLNLAGGFWDGNGIISEIAAEDALHVRGLGVADNSVLNKATFHGAGVDANAILVMNTYFGDANLDGTVDGDDFLRFDIGIDQSLTGWVNGDFNYDGVVDRDNDYSVLVDAYFANGGLQSPELDEIMARIEARSVPEPASVTLLAGAAAGMLLRRKRAAKASSRQKRMHQ